jgi:CRISPR type III-associated protein (TIGR04423 family)
MSKQVIINITDIPLCEYEGYLWYSDQERPQYISKEKKFSADLLTSFPFVVEGALYCAEKNISISIRWAESKQDYIITQFDGDLLKDKANYKCICHTWFVAKDSQRRAKMREVWTLQCDEYSKMHTFRPAFWIFQGFISA